MCSKPVEGQQMIQWSLARTATRLVVGLEQVDGRLETN